MGSVYESRVPHCPFIRATVSAAARPSSASGAWRYSAPTPITFSRVLSIRDVSLTPSRPNAQSDAVSFSKIPDPQAPIRGFSCAPNGRTERRAKRVRSSAELDAE